MSAFIVSTYHIDRIVATAIRGPKDKEGGWYARDDFKIYYPVQDGAALAQMLHNENVTSVNYRYQDSEQPEQFAHFDLNIPAMTCVEALKALACYEYQSCEHPGWESSKAKEFCDRLRSAIIHVLPGYDSATWEQVPDRVTA